MKVSESKFGLKSEKIVDVINVKTDPLMISTLIERPGIHRAYHMNKSKWISIIIEAAEDDDIMDLIDLSYRLTE